MMFWVDLIVYLVIMVIHELTHGLVLFFSLGSDKIAGIRFSKLGVSVQSTPIVMDSMTAHNFYTIPIIVGLVLIGIVTLFIPTEFWYLFIAYMASCIKDMYALYLLGRNKL